VKDDPSQATKPINTEPQPSPRKDPQAKQIPASDNVSGRHNLFDFSQLKSLNRKFCLNQFGFKKIFDKIHGE